MTRCSVGPIAWLLAVAVLSSGCAGDISGSGDDPFAGVPAGDDPTALRPGDPTSPASTPVPAGLLRAADLAPARARRLTAIEIRNSVADIFFAGALDRVPALVDPVLDG